MDQITVNFNLVRDNIIKPNNTLDLNDIKKGKKKNQWRNLSVKYLNKHNI